MKQYKLIEEYPGSPKLDTVVELTNICGWGHWYKDFSTNSCFQISYVENFNNFWEEIKNPLFITEDSVGIFAGDIFWFVDSSFELGQGKCTNNHTPIKGIKEFSNFDLARKYINQNKPKFSIKQIEDALKTAECSYNQSIQTIFKERLGI